MKWIDKWIGLLHSDEVLTKQWKNKSLLAQNKLIQRRKNTNQTKNINYENTIVFFSFQYSCLHKSLSFFLILSYWRFSELRIPCIYGNDEFLSLFVFVKTPAQLNMTSTADGFYMKMTLHPPPNPTTTQELYSRSLHITRQCKLTQSLTTISDYLSQLS